MGLVTKTLAITSTGATAWFQLEGGPTHIHIEGTTGGSTYTLQTTLDDQAADPVELDADGEKIWESVDEKKSAIVTLGDIYCRINVTGGTPNATVRFQSTTRV